MNLRSWLSLPLPALFAGATLGLGACSSSADHPAVAQVSITTTAVIPPDGQCTHIKATRLADFTVSEYKGMLSTATLQALTGEHRVTATAYAPPCSIEPATPPWVIAPIIVSFDVGANSLALEFKRNVPVAIDPVFDEDPAPLAVRTGSYVRTSRNGEDTTGPNFALDGWELRQLTLPPAVATETLVFTTQGKGVPYSPRGVARLPDGTFAFQLSETSAPLYLFGPSGAAMGTWPVSYAPGLTPFDNTDGIEAIDATHFVRTGWSGAGINCDPDGNCMHGGIDFMTRTINADGSSTVQVTRQLPLPAPHNEDYPVGVAPIAGGKLAVTTLPASGTNLLILNADGTLAAGPTAIAGDVEGLFDDGAGRIIAVDYVGLVTTYNDATGAVRSGETADLGEGARFSTPTSLVWRPASGNFVALSLTPELVFATPSFDRVTPTGLNLSQVRSPSAIDYRADTDELLVADLFPATDATTGVRSASVYFYSLATNTPTRTVRLAPGLALPLRFDNVAWVPGANQLVTHYRRPGVVDAQVDAVAYVLNLDGSFAYSFDLSVLGIKRIRSLRYVAASDELFFVVDDTSKTTRVLVTDRFGTPRRSYRVDALPDLSALAPITTGPTAGEFGAITSQPSAFARISLP
jgi:hypothetical protein